MSKDNHLSDKFIEAIAQYHNPETIFKLAKTDIEKAIAIEFYLVKFHLEKQDNDIKWLKYLVKAVFGISFIGVAFQAILKFFGL